MDLPREQVKADFARHAQCGCEPCKRMVRLASQAEATKAHGPADAAAALPTAHGDGARRRRTETAHGANASFIVLTTRANQTS